MTGVRKIQKGDLVLYKKDFCIVAEIRNPIGFNHFDVMDFDGKMFPAVLRQELDLCDIETLDTVEMDWFDEFTENDCDSSDATATSTEQRCASGGSCLPLATKVEHFQVDSHEKKPRTDLSKCQNKILRCWLQLPPDRPITWRNGSLNYSKIYIFNVNPPGYRTNVI